MRFPRNPAHAAYGRVPLGAPSGHLLAPRGIAHWAEWLPHRGDRRFESPQLHQEVRASRHDFLRRRIARHFRILSNIRGPTLALVCEPSGRRGRYNVERLMAVGREADRSPENLADCQGALGQLLRAMRS
jgi:hypothetical protein